MRAAQAVLLLRVHAPFTSNDRPDHVEGDVIGVAGLSCEPQHLPGVIVSDSAIVVVPFTSLTPEQRLEKPAAFLELVSELHRTGREQGK